MLDLRIHLYSNPCNVLGPHSPRYPQSYKWKIQGGSSFLLSLLSLSLSVLHHGLPNAGSVGRQNETESIGSIHIYIYLFYLFTFAGFRVSEAHAGLEFTMLAIVITLNSWSSCSRWSKAGIAGMCYSHRLHLCSGSFVKICIVIIIENMYKFLSYCHLKSFPCNPLLT